MAPFALWSLLPSLPKLDSLPFPSLSNNIQRRLLSFLITKAVGPFLKGGLDPQVVEADITKGEVKIGALELDMEAVNPLLESIPGLEFQHGTLGSITANVVWPLSFSSAVALELHHVDLTFRLSPSPDPAPNTAAAADSPPPLTSPSPPLQPYSDMADSILSVAVAESFVREELHHSEDESIADLGLPGAFSPQPTAPGELEEVMGETKGEEVTMVAGLIERLLARLSVRVRGVRVRVILSDGVEIELRLGEIFSSEVAPNAVGDAERDITVTRFEIFSTLQPAAPSQPPASPATSTSSSSTHDSTTDDESSVDLSPEQEMYMSQSIADLRTSSASLSSATTSGAGGLSMYASAQGALSAISESSSTPFTRENEEPSPFVDPDVDPESAPPPQRPVDQQSPPRSIPPTSSEAAAPPSQPPEPVGRRLLSLGPTPLLVRLSTTRSSVSISAVHPGPVLLVLGPEELKTFSSLPSSFPSSSPSLPPPPPRSASSAPSLSLSLSLHSTSLILLTTVDSSATPHDIFDHPPPLGTQLPAHLRLRLDGVSFVQDPRKGTTVASVREVALVDGTMDERVGVLPLLVTDWALLGGGERTGGRKSAERTGGGKRQGLGEEVEASDWVLDGLETGGWRAKGRKGKVVGKGEDGVVLRLQGGHTTLTLQPLHAYVDLSLLDRLDSFIAFLSSSSAGAGAGANEPPTSPISSPTSSTPRPHTPSISNFRGVLDDLSFTTTEQQQAERKRTRVRCGLIRVEVRCPAPPVQSTPRGGDKVNEWDRPTRSGIFLVDLQQVRLGRTEGDVGQTVVTCERTALFFIPSKSTRAAAFITLSAFPSPTPTGPNPEPSFPPTLTLRPSSVEFQVPLLRASLDKATFDGLELFVDDLGQWTERRGKAVGEGEEEQARIVGSRYFAKMPVREASETDSSKEGSEGSSEMTVRVAVTDVIVDLVLDGKENEEGTTVPAVRHLKGLVSDLDLKFEVLQNSKNNLSVDAVVVDVKLEDVTVPAAPVTILARTLPGNMATGVIPLIRLSFTSAVEQETGLKESKIQVTLANFTYYLTADLGWLEEVALFAKSPDGAFETVVPNELTRLRIRILDGSVHITPPTLKSHLILSLEDAHVSTNLMPDMPRTTALIEVRGLRALAVESQADLLEASKSAETGRAYWKSMGFVEFLDLQQSVVQVRQGNGMALPDFELLVSQTKVVVAVCADTVGAVAALAGDFTPSLASKSDSAPHAADPPSRRLPTRKQSADLLSSVDSMAFGHAPHVSDMPEYLDDDVPTNLDYLADALNARPGHVKGRRSESLPNGSPDGLVISDIDGETIKMLDPAGVRIRHGYLAEPRDDPDGDLASQAASVVRCRLSDCDVTIHIHEGFDWASTRKAIEAEAKAVRRRLEKIRQLLADGQTADASAEDASVLMFGSVQLGLPPGASELPTGALLAAINEELDDRTEVASTVGSWQSLPGQPSTRKPTLVGKARKRLTRSASFAIEVNLRGVGATFDAYQPANQLASRIRVDVASLDIIDNIRTSTWRKFLTELRASDGGVVRASGASMVRFELNKVRPVGRTASSQEEIVMKIKIFPLRLYIDQDALDFLKAFGGFKVPAAGPALEAEASAGPEPFFQRVEIMPVKIKLDYKPKRVDYHALRLGKVAELMNFFHFDGSEMTLRHLVVTGVSGSTRLSELVQDIWTPDVKANQLADVISGIAPVRSVVNLSSGVANLVLLPIEQYRKDGRFARGLQRGATSFARTTTLEALNVGARLATGTQVILEQAESVFGARFSTSVTAEALASVSEGSPVVLTDDERADLISRYAEQPNDLREGMESAYRSLGDNFRSAAQTILAVPMEVYERSGSEGPVRAVVRAVPIAVLKPMIGASEAVSKALFGLRNTLDPDAQAEAADKYKSRSP